MLLRVYEEVFQMTQDLSMDKTWIVQALSAAVVTLSTLIVKRKFPQETKNRDDISEDLSKNLLQTPAIPSVSLLFIRALGVKDFTMSLRVLEHSPVSRFQLIIET